MTQGSSTAVIVALACNLGIAGAKFAGALLTGSSAMMSEAIHSLIDTSNQALLLYGQRRAARPPDARHPFGYARELYFWSFVVAILLFSLGAGVAIYEGIDKILRPHPIESPQVAYVILAIATMLEAISLRAAWLEFAPKRAGRSMLASMRASKDAALITLLVEDTAALVGLLLALIGLAAVDVLGVAWADGAASIAIGALLAAVAAFLAIEVKSLLIGEAASGDVIQGVRDILAADAAAHPLIRAAHDIRTLQLGAHDILVTASIDADDRASAREVEAANARIEDAVRARFPDVRFVYVKVQSSAAAAGDPKPGTSPAGTAPAVPLAKASAADASTAAARARPPSGKRGKRGRKRR